jgi:hypothetical protein
MTLGVAVVGAGIFGVTCADELARLGHRVTLFEAGPEILGAASGINQYRLHRGYHYPRSPDTARASRDAEASFRSVYGPAVVDSIERYYAIAADGSLTTGAELLDFCELLALPYELALPPFLAPDRVELSIQVSEGLLDLDLLRRIARERLERSGADVRLAQPATVSELDAFDLVVVCAYAGLNEALGELGTVEYQFEVVEKPVVRPPQSLAGQSIVVLDGPFMCLDPFGATGLSVLGNVVHAIHHSNTGRLPEIPAPLAGLLHRGVVERPPVTRFARFVEAGSEFVPEMARLEHVGSMFAIRTVFPGLDDTDARPTLVRRLGERVITVFSGKIGTCVQAAREVAALVESPSPAAAVALGT